MSPLPWGLAAISDLALEYEEVQGIKVTIGYLNIRHGEKAVCIKGGDVIVALEARSYQ